MLALWIIGGIVGYLFIGMILSIVMIKIQGIAMDEIEGEDVVIPVLMWPFFFLALFVFRLYDGFALFFRLVASKVFKVPSSKSSNTKEEEVDEYGAPVETIDTVTEETQHLFHNTQNNSISIITTHRDIKGENTKPDVIPPSQKEVSRFDLMDME